MEFRRFFVTSCGFGLIGGGHGADGVGAFVDFDDTDAVFVVLGYGELLRRGIESRCMTCCHACARRAGALAVGLWMVGLQRGAGREHPPRLENGQRWNNSLRLLEFD